MQPTAVLVSLHHESSTSCHPSPSAEAAHEGLARDDRANDHFGALRSEMQQLRSEMLQLRSDMSALAWRLFAALVTVVTAATAAIMTAIAVWG